MMYRLHLFDKPGKIEVLLSFKGRRIADRR
jgi:hypothetical protein